MKLSVFAIAALFAACGTIEDGAIDVGTGTDETETTESGSEVAGSGIDDGVSSSVEDEQEEAANLYSGRYVVTSVTANDYYNMYYYDVVGGHCGMELTHAGTTKYDVVENNDCTLRDNHGDVFIWNDASEFTAVLDKFGAIVDVERVDSSAGSEIEDGSIISFEMRFTETRAISKVVRMVETFEVEYTYEYTRM